MRLRDAIIVSLTFLPCGCSAYIARSGQDLGHLKTREEVREAFGTPTIKQTAEQPTFDEFHTRRKIADRDAAYMWGIGAGVTGGLSEIIVLPAVLGQYAGRKLVGQTIRFEYDKFDHVSQVYLNGRKWPWTPDRSPRQTDYTEEMGTITLTE